MGAKIIRGNSEIGAALQVIHETNIVGRSITPTTHLQRDMFLDVSDLEYKPPVCPVGMNQALFYIDTFNHTTWHGEILRFGINTFNDTLKRVLSAHNTKQQQNLSSLTFAKISNASSNATNYQQYVEKVELTDCEIELIMCAVDYLNTSGRKLVLVDTFERELSTNQKKGLAMGDIYLPKTTDPVPTHTVALYKNTKNDILVIDPNNPKFSGHLQHMTQYTTSKFLVDSSGDDRHKIYQVPEGAQKGHDKILFRDCIDVIAKLAALLDRDANDYTSFDDILKSHAVSFVSNNPNITGLVITDNPMRMKQVSHLGKMKDINDALLKESTQIKQAQKDLKQQKDTEIKALESQIASIKSKFMTESSDLIENFTQLVVNLGGHCSTDPDLQGGAYG